MSFPSSSNFLFFWQCRFKNWSLFPIVMPFKKHDRVPQPRKKWDEASVRDASLTLKLEGVAHYVLRIRVPGTDLVMAHGLYPIQMSLESAKAHTIRQYNDYWVHGRGLYRALEDVDTELLWSFTPLAEVVWLDKTAPVPHAPSGYSTLGWGRLCKTKAHQLARQMVTGTPVLFKGTGRTVQLFHLHLKSKGIPHQVWDLGGSGYEFHYLAPGTETYPNVPSDLIPRPTLYVEHLPHNPPPEEFYFR